MGARSVELDINYGPQVVEEDERASLPPLTLGRGLDIALERPLERQTFDPEALVRGNVNWSAAGRATDSAALAGLEPDRAREVERPMRLRTPFDARIDRAIEEVSGPLERVGGLGRSEQVSLPRQFSPSGARAEPVSTSPGVPDVRPIPGDPRDGVPNSTVSPPPVYNDPIGATGRFLPVPFSTEQTLPPLSPPPDGTPLEAPRESLLWVE